VGFDGGEISLVAQDWVAVRAADHAAGVEIPVWDVPAAGRAEQPSEGARR